MLPQEEVMKPHTHTKQSNLLEKTHSWKVNLKRPSGATSELMVDLGIDVYQVLSIRIDLGGLWTFPFDINCLLPNIYLNTCQDVYFTLS